MPCKLSVNVNAIAYLRNRRDLPWPSVETLSRVALDAGAVGITVHPRPDERHIRRTDVGILRDMLRKDYPGREFNIEGFPDARFLSLVEEAKPEQVTLVPDDPTQGTSDHGWDIAANRAMTAALGSPSWMDSQRAMSLGETTRPPAACIRSSGLPWTRSQPRSPIQR